MTADLTGKLPVGTRRIRITTNLQIYWDNILISRTAKIKGAPDAGSARARRTEFPRIPAEDRRPAAGQREIHLRKSQRHWPLHAPRRSLHALWRRAPAARRRSTTNLSSSDRATKLRSTSIPRSCLCLPQGWVRDYFFIANGYEKDMDFYAYRGDTVDPLPFRDMNVVPRIRTNRSQPTPNISITCSNTTRRFMSGNEASGYSFQYPDEK